MKAQTRQLGTDETGEIELADEVFGLEPRADILHRVVQWQLAKRRAGTHKVKERGEVERAGHKIWKQKGTGRARHSSRTPNIFRGGGVAHGPRPRDHAIDLPKKVRKLGLRHALSAKLRSESLIVLEAARLEEGRTRALAEALAGLGLGSVLIIDGPELDVNFTRAARNLPGVDLLPSQGANVYDILRRDTLVLTRAAVEQLEARLR